MTSIKFIPIVAIIAAAGAGCASSYTSYSDRGQSQEADSLYTHPMTFDDVIALSKEGVGDQVIIDQLKATNSTFHLTTDDIIDLKKAGVRSKVISAMIERSEDGRTGRRYATYYPPYYNYGYPFYFGLGFTYYRPLFAYRAYRPFFGFHRFPVYHRPFGSRR